MRQLIQKSLTRLLCLALFSCLLIACEKAEKVQSYPVSRAEDAGLADGQNFSITVQADDEVYVGEPFEYRIRVLYRSDKVVPDFPGLVRNVRFVPFEQTYLSRPAITNRPYATGINEYVLSYPVLGISVLPHAAYTLDPIRLTYHIKGDEKLHEKLLDPIEVKIGAYYPPEIFGIPFQPLQVAIQDYYLLKQLAIGLAALLLLLAGGLLIRSALRKQQYSVTTEADRIRQQYDAVASATVDNRQSLLGYERVFLSLLIYYRKYTAREFWVREPGQGDTHWRQYLLELKQGFRPAYHQAVEPDLASVGTVRDTVQQIFSYFDADIRAERLATLDQLQGTLRQRLSHNRWRFAIGALILLFGSVFFILLVRPVLWRDADTALYNGWINGLPVRMFDNSQDNKLGTVDVQMLVQMSEEQEILQKLVNDRIKSAYLYDYGTLVARAYIAIISGENVDAQESEETEAPNKPSFEFPKQLLANSVRLFPDNEDSRRNLELAIMLRESEKKDDENSKVEGELGPPLPGFSRDMKQLQF